jgi:hypothetical protein
MLSSYEATPHVDPGLREQQNRARQELWHWSNSTEDRGGSALMLGTMTGQSRTTLMGFLIPSPTRRKSMTEEEIKAFVETLKKPEKNKDQAKRAKLDPNTGAFIRAFLEMVYKAFDRTTKMLQAVNRHTEGMSALKITHKDKEETILLYNFCHSRFQNAAETVETLIAGRDFKHTLVVVDPPWGITKDGDSPDWDHASKKWGITEFEEVLRFVSTVNPNEEFNECTIILHVPDNYLPALLSVVESQNLHFSEFVWAKNSGLKQGNNVRWAHENVVVVSNRKKTVRNETLYNKEFPDRYDTPRLSPS